jgi:hypothetical protein
LEFLFTFSIFGFLTMFFTYLSLGHSRVVFGYALTQPSPAVPAILQTPTRDTFGTVPQQTKAIREQIVKAELKERAIKGLCEQEKAVNATIKDLREQGADDPNHDRYQEYKAALAKRDKIATELYRCRGYQ